MPKYLANENVPVDVIAALRQAAYDVAWMAEVSPGADDDAVLALSISSGRVLLTFDKDFGEMTFRRGRNASCGIVLFRPRLRSSHYVATFALLVLAQSVEWERHFSVAQEGKLRVVPLP